MFFSIMISLVSKLKNLEIFHIGENKKYIYVYIFYLFNLNKPAPAEMSCDGPGEKQRIWCTKCLNSNKYYKNQY